MQNLLRNRILMLVAGAAAFSLGAVACVISTGDGDDLGPCSPVGSNSHQNSSGTCICDPTYDWCDPVKDPGPNGTHNCCESSDRPDTNPVGGPCASGEHNVVNENQDCLCLDGYTWCDVNDINNLNCCPEGDNTSGTDSGSDSGTGSSTDPGVEPPEDCLPTETYWCTHTEAMGPVGSKYYICENGKWIDHTADLDGYCQDEGFGFAYGCYVPTQGTDIKYACEYGSGAPCTDGTPPTCSPDSEGVLACYWGRETYESCTPCKVGNQEFEFGTCELQEGVMGCVCSDTDPNETTGTDETGDTGDTQTSTETTTDETATTN